MNKWIITAGGAVVVAGAVIGGAMLANAQSGDVVYLLAPSADQSVAANPQKADAIAAYTSVYAGGNLAKVAAVDVWQDPNASTLTYKISAEICEDISGMSDADYFDKRLAGELQAGASESCYQLDEATITNTAVWDTLMQHWGLDLADVQRIWINKDPTPRLRYVEKKVASKAQFRTDDAAGLVLRPVGEVQ